jgi:hypothetical protein
LSAEFCPQCGVERVGAFRFCRGCKFDFDSVPDMAAVPRHDPAPTLATSVVDPVASPPVQTVAVPAPTIDPGPAIGKRGRFTRRNIAVGVVGTLVVMGAIGSITRPASSGSPSQPPAALVGAAKATARTTPSPTATLTGTPVPTEAATPTLAPTPEPTPEPTAAPVSYAKLTSRAWAKVVKSPDSYIGKGYQVWGCISQFDAATGTDSFRAEASYKNQEYWYSDSENAYFTGNATTLSDFVQGDIVFMKVISLGSLTYDTQIGGSTTVPLFEVERIIRKGSCD